MAMSEKIFAVIESIYRPDLPSHSLDAVPDLREFSHFLLVYWRGMLVDDYPRFTEEKLEKY